MNSLIVYHSQFGNTKTLAEMIHKELQSFGPARLMRISEVHGDSFEGIDLLVVGGPTQAHGTSPAVKPFLDAIKTRDLSGIAAATFDTRLKGPALLWGSAAKPAAHALEEAGVALVVPPESFLVRNGRQPQLEAGEEERAQAWAASLGHLVAQPQPAIGR